MKLKIIRLLIIIQNLKYKTMPSYCLKCKKMENINPKVWICSGKTMLLSKCDICGS